MSTGPHIISPAGDRLPAIPLGDGRFLPEVALGSFSLDSFGRVPVASPFTEADLELTYSLLSRQYDPITANGGAINYLADESSAQLQTSTADASSAIFQTRRYFIYQAGKGQVITLTCVPGTGVSNVRKRWGYFDGDDGIFFEQSGSAFSVNLRSSVSGAAVDTSVAQADFNIDPVDGTGPSGLTLDLSKGNIFLIDLQWLGMGIVTLGVWGPNGKVPIHQFKNPNANTAVYMRTANLPVRWEIVNLAAQSSTTDFIVTCASVVSSGGSLPPGYEFVFSSGVVTTGSADPLHLITYRLASTFKGLTNRTLVLPEAFNFQYQNNDAKFMVYYHRGTVTGGAWVAVTGNSAVEYNVTPSAVSPSPGSKIVDQSYIGASTPQTRGPQDVRSSFSDLAMSLSADGTSSDYITLYAQRLTSTDVDVVGGMQWNEIR